MKRIAVYDRVPDRQGSRDGDLQKRIQYYNDVIEKHKDQDWQLYKCYIDRNSLGFHPRNRDGFREMMIDAELGCFDLIIVHDMSRFSRSLEELVKEVEEFCAIGVGVYFIEESIQFSETN